MENEKPPQKTEIRGNENREKIEGKPRTTVLKKFIFTYPNFKLRGCNHTQFLKKLRKKLFFQSLLQTALPSHDGTYCDVSTMLPQAQNFKREITEWKLKIR